MKVKRLTAVGLTVAMVASLLCGCGNTTSQAPAATDEAVATEAAATEVEATEAAPAASGDVKEFTAFFAVPGNEINDDNAVQQMITEKVGAKCKETWLTGQTAEEAVGVLIAGGEYPDFIVGSSGASQLIDAGALNPLEDYLEKYPNLKNLLSEQEWNMVRNEDGHIYIIPLFGIINGEDKACAYNDEAFWIQTRVLKEAGYPEIKTLDQYFDVIEAYMEKHPTAEDGSKTIGYECLSDDWRYFCIENAPFFLAGYPNDGCCMVDRETGKVSDYNTSDIAKQYFQKLNEEFKKGVVDPETFTNKYDQYIAKLSTGNVLGMCDQHWDFLDAENAIKTQNLEGCTYVPLALTMDESIEPHYYSKPALDVTGGIGITTSCEDVEGAMKFMSDLMEEEIQTLRMWGVKDKDYLVDDQGVFYMDETMRHNYYDQTYRAANLCFYSYFPHWEGTSLDGINAWRPDNQPGEFFDALDPDAQECLKAYGAQTYCDMLNKPYDENAAWYPMWSYANAYTTDTPAGLAKVNMDEVKHEYLPKVVMADNFDSQWEEYMTVLKDRADLDEYLSDLQKEVDRRKAIFEGK